MSDVTYILGTLEYVVVEVDCTTPGATFTASEWGAEAAFCLVGTPFDAASATWYDATLETVSTKDYAKVLCGSVGWDPDAGTYKVFVRLTKDSGGTEIPVLRALGKVIVTAG